MKAHVLYGALALCVFACNRPDSALFGPDAPPPEGEGGSSGTASGGSAPSSVGGSDASSGGSLSEGGSAAAPSTGGTDAGGTEPGGGSAGEPTEMPGGAGQATGGTGQTTGGTGQTTGGTDNPPDPPAPVCGNGVIEMGEECDDSNRAGMDGCEKCKVSCAHFGVGTVKSEDHHCYAGYDQAAFEGAVTFCKARGAHLVTISSAAENAIVQKLVSSSKFIGGFEDVGLNEEGKGDYRWITGEPLSYTNWAQGEPDMDDDNCLGWGNQRCYEHCLAMVGQGKWEDRRCDQLDGYVCEWEPAGSVP